VWVWTDELLESTGTGESATAGTLPLVGYAIEEERDLRNVAKEILRLAAAPETGRARQPMGTQRS